jgi:uncharacterized protein (TIGR02145 family)
MKKIFLIIFLLVLSTICFSQNTCPATVDYEGKTYHAVQIGSQCWLKENLDVGNEITSYQEQADNGIMEKYCYDDNPDNCLTYGGLYQWDEALQYKTSGSKIKGICPAGWHIPDTTEVNNLIASVNGDGNALKNAVQESAGTNTSGFSALLGGYRSINGYFNVLGMNMYMWTSNEVDEAFAKGVILNNVNGEIIVNKENKGEGLSIRCIKDN